VLSIAQRGFGQGNRLSPGSVEPDNVASGWIGCVIGEVHIEGISGLVTDDLKSDL
jgi:hypothetical protein